MPLHQLIDVFAEFVDALSERCEGVKQRMLDRHDIQHDVAPRFEQLGVNHRDDFRIGHNGARCQINALITRVRTPPPTPPSIHFITSRSLSILASRFIIFFTRIVS